MSIAPPLASITSVVETMKEHPPDDGSKPELLARSLSLLLIPDSVGFSLDLAVLARDDYSGVVLDDAWPLILEFACDQKGVQPDRMLLEAADFRRAFIAGVALRELEPYFPAST